MDGLDTKKPKAKTAGFFVNTCISVKFKKKNNNKKKNNKAISLFMKNSNNNNINLGFSF